MSSEDAARIFTKAKALAEKGDYFEALEKLEFLTSTSHTEDVGTWLVHYEKGKIFLKLAEINEKKNLDVKFAYVLASVSCFSEDSGLSWQCARGLYDIAKHLGSVLYFKKCVEKAKRSLSAGSHLENTNLVVIDSSFREQIEEKKKGLERLIKDAESMIAVSKTSSLKSYEKEVLESVKSSEPREKDDAFKGLRLYWNGLDVKTKREFMIVSIAELKSFVEGVHKKAGRLALENILTCAKESRKWPYWLCRSSCRVMYPCAEDCKNHLEQKHAAYFISLEENSVKRIGKNWSRKISVGGWEPIDTVAAVEMIKNQLEDVKAFTSKSKKNGWSSEWPLAADEERSELLQQIKLLLMRLCEHKILSCSVRDWMMRFTLERLGKLGVSKQSLTDSHLMETPQSICFMECPELSQIRTFLEKIKCERQDGTDMVCRAADCFWGGTRVKETIDFDPQFSFLILDKRLLKSSLANAPFDDEGKVNVYDPDIHYAKAHAQGDDIISWLVDRSSEKNSFPKHIRELDRGIWVAVLKAFQFTCRALATKYSKKYPVLEYQAALTFVENICITENERRRNLQEGQYDRYASLLRERCEEEVLGNSLIKNSFLCAVRDVLEGASHPTFYFTDLEVCLTLIRERESVSDDMVLMSIDLLKSVVTHKVLLFDSKILLIDNSRIRLLNNLTKLSVFDDRSSILQVLKSFLLEKILNMESKAKSDASKADLLREEEKKTQAKKKKEKKKIKRTSTSVYSPLDKNVESEPPVNLEPEGTSPSLKTVEDDSMEPEDTLATERDPLEISSDTDHQEEATNDMQNLAGGDSLSEHLEPALEEAPARYNSALDITLKALMNINVLRDDLKHNAQPSHNYREEQVPCALQNFFSAVVSEEIKIEGVYSVLLTDILASLEVVCSMPSDAAEVLVTILEFLHSWKYSEGESLVTRLFTLEEDERMSCRKCKRKTNYVEQSSYGIVVAADSIRQLKCEFGNVKFVDVLKVIRMEDQMLCDIRTGGCGETNFVHHVIRKCPSIFIIVLEWEKSETEKEISETTNALDLEIDISRMYKGLEPNTNYRLVSMVGSSKEEEEHVCIAYEKTRWVNLKRESLTGEDVGNWKNVVRLFEERKIRPEILFYEKLLRSIANNK